MVLDFSEPLLVVEDLPNGSQPGPPTVAATADGPVLLRDRLTRWLEADGRLKIVGMAGSRALGLEARQSEMPPDVVLMDLHLAEIEGSVLGHRLLHESSTMHLLVLPADFDGRQESQPLRDRPNFETGALTPQTVITRLIQSYGGQSNAGAADRAQISRRELSVLVEVGRGGSNKQIAKHLGISQKTVRNHLSRIFTKLGASNRTEAVMNAMRRGLLDI